MAIDSEFLLSVDQASQLLNNLTELLEKERHALETSNAKMSQELLTEKTTLLQSLEQNAMQRRQLLLSQGMEANQEGVVAFFETLPESLSQKIKPRWETLQSQMQNCKDSNAVNGKIIHRSRQQIDTLLGLLQGNENSGKIYTHSGKAQSVNRNATLAKA